VTTPSVRGAAQGWEIRFLPAMALQLGDTVPDFT